MAKLLFISNKDNNFYNFRSEKILKFKELGHKIVLLCPYGEKIDYFTERGCRFINMEIDRRGTNPIKDFILLKNYVKVIKKERPDIVFTYTTKSSIYGALACRLLNVPCIVNNAGLIDPNEYKWYVGLILKFLYKRSFAKSSCMMYQNALEREVLNRILHNKVHYRDIPGSGVNIDKFKYTDYPENDDIIRFNWVARIVDIKGINELIACAERIKGKYPNTEFVLYGDYDDDSYRERIEECEKRGVVKYGGIQLDMRPHIAASHCVIHTSYYEGMTNVILEHGAMGRPAIASNIPGCREAIDDGISGFTFEVKNVDDLVDKVEKFILLSHEEKVEMGKAARRKMEKEFDRNIVTDIYLEEINKILYKLDV